MSIQDVARSKPKADSYVEITAHGAVAMVGADAISLYRAISLLHGMELYLKTGMLPTRGVTGPKMLVMATGITKNEYKGNGKYDRALEDLRNWIETMKCAMPVVDNGRAG